MIHPNSQPPSIAIPTPFPGGNVKKIWHFLGKRIPSQFVYKCKGAGGITATSMNQTINKLSEEEIAWLMSVLTPGDCKSCIWRNREEEKYRCFPCGESPCKVFADKVLYGLERSGLIWKNCPAGSRSPFLSPLTLFLKTRSRTKSPGLNFFPTQPENSYEKQKR